MHRQGAHTVTPRAHLSAGVHLWNVSSQLRDLADDDVRPVFAACESLLLLFSLSATHDAVRRFLWLMCADVSADSETGRFPTD